MLPGLRVGQLCGLALPPGHGQQALRRGAEAGRRFPRTGLRDRRAGLPEAAVRRRAAGKGDRASRRPPAPPSLPRHPRSGPGRRRARPALDRLPARLPEQRRLLRLLHRQARATSRSTSSTAGPADPGGSQLAAERDRDPPPGQRQPQRRPAAVLRRPPLSRHRGRRLGGRPARTTPRTRTCCWASCCGSTRGPPTDAPYTVPAANPFVGKPGRDEIYSYGLRNPFRFSFDTVSGGPPRIAIGDVGQDTLRGGRLHDGRRRGRRQLRLGRLRGIRPLPRRKQRHSRPRRHGQADLRLPAQPRRQLRGDRRLRRRRPPPARPSTAATSTPTSARGSCAASSPTCTAGRATTAGSGSRWKARAPSEKTTRGASTSARSRAPSSAWFPASGYSWLTSQGPAKGAPGGERHGGDEHGGDRRDQRGRVAGGRPDHRGSQPGDRRGRRLDRGRHAGDDLSHGGAGPRRPAGVGGARKRGPPSLARQVPGLDPRQHRADRRHDAVGDGQGPRRHLGGADLPRRPDQLLRLQGGQVHRRGNRAPSLPPAGHQEAHGPVPALSRGRRDQPLELPDGAGSRRRRPGPAGRRRGRGEALRVHAAGPDRSRQGLEGGDRRARRLRLSCSGPARRARRWSTTSTSSSSRAPTGPDARSWPGPPRR